MKTIAELSTAVAGKISDSEGANVSKTDVRRVIDGVVSVLREQAAAGHDVTIPHLGRFRAAETAARKGRNLHTGEDIDIPAKKVLRFSPSADMKRFLNGE